MTEHAPYETEQEARAAVEHILASPESSRMDGNLRLLEDTCRAAGVQLGAFEHQVLLRLAGWSPAECSAVARIIEGAHAALPRRQRDRPQYHDEAPGVAMEGGMMNSGPMNYPPGWGQKS